MATYLTLVYAAFSGGANGINDAWAEGNANWIADNTAVLADQASLVDADGVAQASPYALVVRREDDGTLTPTGKGWHLDAAGRRVNTPPPDGRAVDGSR